MANLNEDPNPKTNEQPISFPDFPEDVQLSILSFLTPSEISTFASTSKRFVSICRNDDKLWFSMCDRRWGSKTHITKWGNGKISYKFLYKTLVEYENLIGFWRRSGERISGAVPPASPPLIFFEWGRSFVTGSRVLSSKNGSYEVTKLPFLWMSLNREGEALGYLDPDCRIGASAELIGLGELEFSDCELVPVSVSFMGRCHLVVEEIQSLGYSGSNEDQKTGFRRSSSYGNLGGEGDQSSGDGVSAKGGSPGSLPDKFMSEIYQYFANRTSPSGRRQRKKEKERQWRKKWETEHFVKIVNCSPTPSRPLQGLWKGICGDMNLDFYLVAYDDIGGIACRRVGDPSKPFSGFSPVFWTTNTTFIESPFSPEENYLYDSRVHLRPIDTRSETNLTENEDLSRILYINSSYDLVIADLAGNSVNPLNVEGRIWQYPNGTFGFGFLRDSFIVDLKHIARNGCLLDAIGTL